MTRPSRLTMWATGIIAIHGCGKPPAPAPAPKATPAQTAAAPAPAPQPLPVPVPPPPPSPCSKVRSGVWKGNVNGHDMQLILQGRTWKLARGDWNELIVETASPRDDGNKCVFPVRAVTQALGDACHGLGALPDGNDFSFEVSNCLELKEWVVQPAEDGIELNLVRDDTKLPTAEVRLGLMSDQEQKRHLPEIQGEKLTQRLTTIKGKIDAYAKRLHGSFWTPAPAEVAAPAPQPAPEPVVAAAAPEPAAAEGGALGNSVLRECTDDGSTFQKSECERKNRGKTFDFEGQVRDIRSRKMAHVEIDSGNYADVVFVADIASSLHVGDSIRFRGRLRLIGTGIVVAHDIDQATLK